MSKGDDSSHPIMLKLARLLRSSRFAGIARRYLVLNAFDGVMAALGFVIGYFAGGGVDVRWAFKGITTAAAAMAISGFVSALLTETAEQRRELLELEKALMRKLSGTLIERSMLLSAVLAAFVNALAPLAGVLVVALPLWEPVAAALGPRTAAMLSIASGLASLFALGLALKGLSRSSIGYGAAFLASGVAVALIGGA